MSQIEQQILDLENANKQRKTAYPIAGSLVGFASSMSSTFSKSGGGTVPVTAQIKFQADSPGDNGKTLVTLWPQVSANSDFSTIYPMVFSANEPQAGDGSIILDISIATPYATGTYYFRALSTGSSTGTFTLL